MKKKAHVVLLEQLKLAATQLAQPIDPQDVGRVLVLAAICGAHLEVLAQMSMSDQDRSEVVREVEELKASLGGTISQDTMARLRSAD